MATSWSPAFPRRALTVLAGALAATVVALGMGMPAARAHDELVATTPAQEATVPAPLAGVTLEFSQAVQALGTQVLVSAPDGAPVSQGAAEIRNGTVVQPLVADALAGRHTVTWRVTSSDGHVLSGEFAFTVAESAPALAASPAIAPANRADDDASGTAAQRALPSFTGSIAVGAALVAIAGGLVVFLRRRRT